MDFYVWVACCRVVSGCRLLATILVPGMGSMAVGVLLGVELAFWRRRRCFGLVQAGVMWMIVVLVVGVWLGRGGKGGVQGRGGGRGGEAISVGHLVGH